MLGVSGSSPRFEIASMGVSKTATDSNAKPRIPFKINDLDSLTRFSLTGKTVKGEMPKAGLVYALFAQFRPSGKTTDEKEAFLVKLFESSDVGKESENEVETLDPLLSDEVEEEDLDEETLEFEEDLDVEEDPFEMAGGGFDESSEEDSQEGSELSEEVEEMLLFSKGILLKKWMENKDVYASPREGLPSLRSIQGDRIPIKLVWNVAADRGLQPAMEEIFLSENCEGGALVAIFKGTKEKATSFAQLLASLQSPEKALQQYVKELDPLQNSELLACFIDFQNGFIYSVGWGESEICLYRKVGSHKTIPLSLKGHADFSVKVSFNTLCSGDTILLASSGCKRYFSEEEIQGKVGREDLALSLLNDALYIKRSVENATVIALNVI